MSYGKPSAWARSQGSQQQLNPNLFTGQLGLAASSQSFAGIPGMPLAGLVNQAAFSNTMGMNMLAAQAQQRSQQQMIAPQQQQVQRQQSQQQQSNSSPARSQRTFVGVITKLMETYGFVDEDVFFQTSVIRGSMPRLGDRVMVEANYNPSMPFKWNAYLVRLLQDNTPSGGGSHSQQQQNRQSSQQNGGSASRWSGGSGGDRRSNAIRDEPRRQPPPIARRSPAKRPSSHQRSPRRSSPRNKREPSPRREIHNKKERDMPERGDSISIRGQSTKDTDSPPRRRQRIIPRYHCNMPKQTLPMGELKYTDLRRRYANLYIPSDFIRLTFDWISSIPLEQPIKFSPHPINFHVLHKDIDLPLAIGEEPPIENPSDADYRYIVKVMLISHPGLASIRRKLSGLMADGTIDESAETQPLTKTIQLLVGHRGKGEYMCIGGAWSPSLDGPNPLDPITLVNTAIRTTRAMTGLDLSDCSKWYKIAHLRYLRSERQRIDSVVLMMPDTSAIESFKVTDENFKIFEQALRDQLSNKLLAIDAEQFKQIDDEKEKNNGGSGEKKIGEGDQGNNNNNNEKEPTTTSISSSTTTTAVAAAVPPQTSLSNENVVSASTAEEAVMDSSPQKSIESDGIQSTTRKEVKSHWSALEPIIRTMKVAELREELELRGLDSKGLKNVLTQRLLEIITKEKEEEENKSKNAEGNEDENKNLSNNNEDETLTQKINEPSIMVKIKEEIIELMETDEVTEEKKETPEELAKREQEEKERIELEKAKEKFEKDKKERKATLERHYAQIPKEPGIFVYPSKTAKNGKFDCKLMSLHSLLDYRQDDIKESSFEVFLFVEALREALDRSNAFVVYHSIATSLDRESERKRRNEMLAEACKDEEVVVLNEKEKDDEKEKQQNSSSSDKQPKSPVNSSTDLRTNFKAFVNNLDLFSSYVHFDGNICGYLTDRDLEEIINSTGLDLSRGEVKNLVKKLVSKEKINYRDLTDKWVDKEGNVKYIHEPTFKGSLFESYKELAKGHSSLETKMSTSNTSQQVDNLNNINSTNDSSGIYIYEGKIINIKQCLQQQIFMEEERQIVLDKNMEMELQLKTIKESHASLEKKKRRLEDDVDRYRKKLHDSDKNLKKEKEENEMLKKSLNDCKRYGERICSIVENVMPTPKQKENENVGSGSKESINNKEKEVNKEKKESNSVKDTSSCDGGGGVVLLDECKDESILKEDNEKQNENAEGLVIAEPLNIELVEDDDGEKGNVNNNELIIEVPKEDENDEEKNDENK